MSTTEAEADSRKGLAYALGAYALWGLMPLYVVLMVGINAFELVGWRVLASLLFAALFLWILGGWRRVGKLFRDKRALLWLSMAGVAILVNWTTFAYAVLTERVLDTSLGYFLNPLISIILAVIVLRERMRPLQWVAAGLMVIAVVVMIVGYGTVPLIALILASAFGTYGLLKKQVGSRVDALAGFTVETAATLPFAIGMLVVVGATSGLTVIGMPAYVPWLVLGFGFMTALPLLLFAAAARRLTLIVLGFLQYLAPSMSFVFGVFLLGEPMPLERLLGFAIVWLALIVMTADTVIHGRRSRKAAKIARVEPTP
ncbi:EamA family transporter RarD [uncultured Agrococcus sp.]|uniref:EamA family transporter RarD n=1 Tax=uncultured Agrococcus sp. TaxID=382258 RepID=UPI0025E8F917|nr:EamA family transporter RarD [uncultured Agrococcus sp.]